MREQHGEPFDASIFVDKHHVQERVLRAARGPGLDWQEHLPDQPGDRLVDLLAGVAVSLELEPDAPALDQCGACTLCIDACPTGALVDAHELDATRCISYLTIELEGPDSAERNAPSVGNHVFGCDICQDVCPWNLAPLATRPAWQPRVAGRRGRRASCGSAPIIELHGLVRGSAMMHSSLSRLRRNLAVVLGNSGDAARLPTCSIAPGGGMPHAAPQRRDAGRPGAVALGESDRLGSAGCVNGRRHRSAPCPAPVSTCPDVTMES